MKEQNRLATKAQAQAVRQYLATLGMTLSHTQALEVLARGQGLRSRQVLAAQLDKLPQAMSSDQWVDANVSGNPALIAAMKNHARGPSSSFQQDAGPLKPLYWTQVSYRYVDGSNCKRYGQMVFRGRLTVSQLKFIQSKLDAGEFFVPAQVGFENLAFAFTDFGGDDHSWHTLELGDPKDWELDMDGYVLHAGDVRQLLDPKAGEFATDADCDNLMFRFARVTGWDTDAQREIQTAYAWRPDEADTDGVRSPSDYAVASMWSGVGATQRCSHAELEALCGLLRDEGFTPREDVPNMLEWTREVGPNAYQFVILQACDPEFGDLALNFDVSTHDGIYVTETPLQALGAADTQREFAQFWQLLDEQLRTARADPRAWSATFE